MYPYVQKDDNEEEFYKIIDIAMGLFSNRKIKRELAKKEMIQFGAKAVRPLVCTIEYAISDHDMSDSKIDKHADLVSEIILEIGKDSLPDLEDFESNGGCNIYINEWAQEMISQMTQVESGAEQAET